MSPKSTHLALGLFFSFFLAQPVLKSQDVILQGFYWNTNPGDITTNAGVWWDTIAGIAPYLQNAGFETVWTPPANKGFGNVYDMGYGVYDYYDFGEFNQKGSIRTRHGNKAQLQSMISALHGNGIKVMADLVLNHRGGGDALEPEDCNDGVNPTDAWTLFTPASGRLPMNAADFHPNFTHCDVFPPYHDRLFFEDLCYFNFLDQTLDPPLNDWYFGPHNLGRAGDSLIVWGRYLLDEIGFDEVRLDAVKHIEPGFLAPFLVELATPNQPFAVGELFDGNLGTLVNYRNEVETFVSNYGIGSKDANLAIFDFNLRYALRDMCNNGGGGFPMHTLNSAGLYFGGGLPGEDVVTFVENHDVDRIGWQVVNCPSSYQVGSTCLQLYTDGGHDPIFSDKEDMGYPFIMAAEGRPTVFWKDLFWYGLKEDIEWQMALRDATAKGTGVRGWNLGAYSPGADSTDVFAMARYGNSGGVNDGMVLVLNDNPGSEKSVWVNTPFTNKYLKDYSDGYLFVTTQTFGDTRANVKAQSRDYAWWSVTGLYPKLPGTTGSNFQMDAEPGGCPHFIALRAADAANLLVNGAPIAVGDEIAVKNGDGDIVGIGRIGQGFQWDGVHDMIIEVLGAPSANGMSNGEQFTFVVYDASANAEVTIGYVQYATAGNAFTFSPDRPDSPNRNGNFSTFNLTATATGLYTCGGITQVLAFGLPVVPLEEQCGATSRADAGAYNDGLQNGDNDGSRFGAWTNVNGGANAGFFIGNSQNNGNGDGNGDGDINTSNEAWGFWANSGATAEATRPFSSALSVGQTFSIKMDNGFIQNGGTVGLVLQNGSGNKVWEFYFVGGAGGYTINDGNGPNVTSITFTDEGLALEFLLTSATTYRLKVTKLFDGTVYTFTGPLITTSPGGYVIQGVRLFNANAGSGGSNDAFYNSMQLCDPPALVINEADYDQPGDDMQEFIELRNMNTTSLNLNGFVLELVNGGDNSVYRTVTLPNVNLPAGDYFVICANGSSVPNCDFPFDGAQSDRIQNGAPDGMRLLWNGVTVDALSYEGTVPGAGEGSGAGLEDSNTIPNVGLSRVPDGSDTDQNNVDFELTCITPGAANAPDNTDTDNDGAPDGCDDCPLAQNEGSIANFNIADCACNPGYFPVTAIVNGQEVITGCQECPPGFFCPDGISAYPCQAGNYQDQPGQTECLECLPGTYQSATGSTSCINCPAGEYQNQPGATACLDCQPGSYQPAQGAVSCINCPAGEYQSQPGQTECLECLPGTYQSATGSTSCINCPAGEYQDQPGQTACLDCLPGTFQPAIGSISCINCPPGKFSAVSGAVECENCLEGKYQPNSGSTSCLNCPVGTYNDQTAQTSCKTCEPGTEAPFTGSALCQNCTPPSFSSCPAVTPVNNTPGQCEAPVTVPTPELSGLCTRNHALAFDGSNDFVDMASALLPTSSGTAFTIEAWIRTTDGDGAIVSQYLEANASRFIFFILNGKVSYWREVSFATSSATVDDGLWHHVVVTRTASGEISLYIDGSQDGTGSDNSGFSNVATLIGTNLVGGGSPDRSFTGDIDEVRIWNYARSSAEINAAKDLEINATYPGLIAFYNFNEGIACCDNTGLTTLPDGMGANNGTLNGFSLASGCTSNWVAGAPALGDPLTLTNDVTADCGDASGTFSAGNTIVTWTATGANGQTATCVQTVTVNDVEDPTIICPAGIIADSDPGQCSVFVPVSEPGWSDNCSPRNNALHSDGINDRVEIPDIQPYAGAGQSFSIEFWINSTEVGDDNPAFLSNYGGSSGQAPFFNLRLNEGEFFWHIRNASSVEAITKIPQGDIIDGTWHHVAGVRDASTNQLFLYLDGVQVASGADPGGSVSYGNSLTLMKHLERWASGTLDEIRVWNYALTLSDITSRMNSELTGTEAGLVHYFNFNQGVANGNNAGETTLTNLGSGSNGVLHNYALNGTTSNWVLGVPVINLGEITLQNNFNGTEDASDIYPVGITTVTWTVTDAAGNSDDCSMTVSVNDTESPNALCKNITVNLIAPGTYTLTAAEIDDNSTDNCTANLSIPPTVFDCGDVGSTIPILLTVSDGVNTDDCTAQVTVADGNFACNQPPTAVCQPVTVNANANCEGTALAEDFDGGSTDPDLDPLAFSVSPAGPYPLGVTNVTLTVMDDDGATDDCTTTITVQDATPPSITCPSNIIQNTAPGLCSAAVTVPQPTLSDNCGASTGTALAFDGTNEYVLIAPVAGLAGTDYTIEGWFKTSTSGVNQVILDGYVPSTTNSYLHIMVMGIDGKLRFLHRQPPGISGGENVYSGAAVNDGNWHHFAAVKGPDGKIRLYLDGVLQGTSAVTVLDLSGAPELNIGRNHNLDWYFNGQLDEIRIWNTARPATAIACGKDQLANPNDPGLVAYYRMDEGMGSTLDDISPNSNTGTLQNMEAADWVSSSQPANYFLVTNDFNGFCDASGDYPTGTTNTVWTVTDAAGNSNTCSMTVAVTDNQPPSITCPASATVSPAPGSCEYTISGTAYDPSGISDNCGIGGAASYSVVSGSVSPASGTTLSGAVLAVGANIIEWSVTDVNSLTGTCQFTLTVSPCTISGKLIWKGPPANTTTGVANATVFLSGDDSDTFGPTLADGDYSFTGFTGSNFTVKPQKTSGMFNGVNVGDATAIQMHLTGPPYVTDFFRLVAADVNKSNTISTLDATIIKQALLGNPAANNILNNTKSWRFISSSFAYPDPAGPFSLPAGMPETRSVTGQASGQDFFGIKVGDFLETANPALSPTQMEPLVWRTADRKLQAGEPLEVTFTASNFEDIAAYQFALDFDPGALAFQSLEVLTDLIPLTLEGNFGLFHIESGELRTLFSMLPGQTLPSKHPVFRVNFTVLEPGQMLSEVLQISQEAIPALAFNTALDETVVELEFYQEITSVSETPAGERRVVLLQNRPNPFDRETTIGFILPEACEAQLRVFDLNGREWWKTSRQYGAGYQEEILRLEHAGASGMLFCELATPFGVVTGKMAMTGN